MNSVLGLLGLAKKAGKLEIGEEPTGAAARARDARLLILASDAAENSARRMRHFADAGQCIWVRIPASKDELGRALGRSSCAMLALTDIGFAAAAAKKLAELDEQFAETAERLEVKRQRMEERRREAEQHEKNLRTGKKKPAAKTAAGDAGTEKRKPAQGAAPAARRPGSAQPGRGVKAAPGKAGERSGTKTVRKTREEKEKLRRAAIKRAGRMQFENSRPVRKGKGSTKKENP